MLYSPFPTYYDNVLFRWKRVTITAKMLHYNQILQGKLFVMTDKFEITNQEIQQAFLMLIGSTKFSKLTINQICSAANISRITFYRHYADKFDLLETINNAKIVILKNYIQCRLDEQDISNTLLRMTKFLKQDAANIESLFKITKIGNQDSLEHKIKELLYDEFSNYMFKELQADVIKGIPVSYFAELYAANATIFIKHSLESGTKPQLITSLNKIQKFVFDFLKSK